MISTKTFACVVLIVFHNFAYSQQIKKIIVGYIDSTDTIVSSIKEYSREGYLLLEDEPEIYCGKTYTYDELGRHKTTEQYCGESMSNGNTHYDYYENKSCISEYAGGYTHIVCDSFGLDRTHLMTTDTYIDYMQEENIRVTLKQYFHNQNLLAKKEETKIEYNKDSTHIDTTFQTTTYTYNTLDSLTGYFIINQKTKDTIEKFVITYDALTNRKIQEVRNIAHDIHPINHDKHTTTYQYDRKSRLIKKQHLEFFLNNPEPHTEHTLEYIFKKGQLYQITEISRNNYESWKYLDQYKNNLLTSQTVYIEGRTIVYLNYYYENLLMKTTIYEKGIVNFNMNYYYTFW